MIDMSFSQSPDEKTQLAPDEELNSLKDMLVDAEKSAAFCQMMAGITHELNTPLGICITANSSLVHSSEIIQNAMEDKTLTADQLVLFLEEIKTITDVVESSLDRTKELVDSIKHVSSEQQINKVEIFNLSKSLKNISQSLLPELKAKNIIFELSCDEGLSIEYRQGDIYSIVCNLIQNSIKHAYNAQDNENQGTERSEGKIALACNYDAQQQTLNMTFEDFGKGMSEQDRVQIFQPYFTTTKSKGGTGLGLAIIKEIVERDGGEVNCHSEIGKGTRFKIKIKCLENHALTV